MARASEAAALTGLDPRTARRGQAQEELEVVCRGIVLRVGPHCVAEIRQRGVDLALCERVTHHLRDLLNEYALEVSSPGPARPLVKPDHFRRFVGRRARVRTRGDHDGRRSFTGELLGATDDAVTVAADDGVVSIPYADITRSNLVGD